MQKIALVLSLALAGTACGGSSSPNEAASDEVTTTTEAATTTTASPVDVDRYCELSVQNDTDSDVFFESEEVFDPIAFEAFSVEARALLVEAMEVADPKIAAPLVSILEQADEASAVLESHDWDIVASIEDFEALDESKYEAAEAALEAYDEEVCGIAPDEEEEEVVEEPVEEPAMEEEAAGFTQEEIDQAQVIVDFMKTPEGLALAVEGFRTEAPGVSEEQAGCFLETVTAEQFLQFSSLADAADVDLADPAVSEIFALMLACDISLADLAG